MGRLVGLTVAGVVKERRRRRVPLDNPKHEIITYTLVDDSEGVYFVDDYEPSKYHNVGDYVMLPVYIKPYIKRNNQASYTICARKGYQTRGEIF
jgi:hypothetical protein